MENKKLIVFDLDGTLTESKAQLGLGMSEILAKLLEKKEVAIISGGAYKQFEKQFLVFKSPVGYETRNDANDNGDGHFLIV